MLDSNAPFEVKKDFAKSGNGTDFRLNLEDFDLNAKDLLKMVKICKENREKSKRKLCMDLAV